MASAASRAANSGTSVQVSLPPNAKRIQAIARAIASAAGSGRIGLDRGFVVVLVLVAVVA